MTSLLAFFTPGPLELLIILVLIGVPLSAVVLVLLLSRSRKNPAASNPNLSPCPGCGNYVSRQAPACPKCGQPLLPEQNS